MKNVATTELSSTITSVMTFVADVDSSTVWPSVTTTIMNENETEYWSNQKNEDSTSLEGSKLLSTILCKSQAMGGTSFFSTWSCFPQIYSKHLENNQEIF